jgi:serine/threonine protein kinase
VTQGLVFLHSLRIVHFDLKSPNILLGRDGQTAKVADVGLARSLNNRCGVRPACPSVHLCSCPSVRASDCASITSVYPSVSPCISLRIRPSVCPSVRLPAHLSIYLSAFSVAQRPVLTAVSSAVFYCASACSPRGVMPYHDWLAAHPSVRLSRLAACCRAATCMLVALVPVHGRAYISRQDASVGTFAWAAPELLLNEKCNEKVDIYR